jgi:hypothetical protein
MYDTGIECDSVGAVISKATQRPHVAMTSNVLPAPYVASASSEYSVDYRAWKAFNKSYADQYGWASAADVANPWLMIKLDKALLDIVVTIYNRTFANYVNGIISGRIFGSNDGVNFTENPIATISVRDGATDAEYSEHECNNKTAYQYIKIIADTWNQDGGTYVAVGEVYIDGRGQVFA